MATKFANIYSLFLPQIDDLELDGLEQSELELILRDYLLNGLLTVQETMSDVLDVDMESNQFNVELPLAEQLLIAKAMKLEWVSEKKYAEELMRKSLGDRDYKAVQGFDYLNELTRVEKDLRQEIRASLLTYAYSKKDNLGSLLNNG